VLKGRWAVEVNLRHLKTTMKMDILRSQTVEGIQKELYMFLIVWTNYTVCGTVPPKKGNECQTPQRRHS